jgi:hypothetical protein
VGESSGEAYLHLLFAQCFERLLAHGYVHVHPLGLAVGLGRIDGDPLVLVEEAVGAEHQLVATCRTPRRFKTHYGKRDPTAAHA